MQKIKILFADDHAIVRDGLRSLFKSDPGFMIVGEAADGAEAVRLVEENRPDVAVLDISMPNVNGIEATGIIKERFPETKILILTIHESEEYIQELILAGADGYVLKNAEKKEIFDGVRAVAAGSTFFSSNVSKALLDGLVRSTRNRVPFQISNEEKLTNRETEVLRLIAEGLTSKQIAEKLHEYTGLPTAYILKANLRVRGGQFRHELLGDDDVTGRLDSRYSGPAMDPLGESASYDPLDSAIDAPTVAEFNNYVRNTLDFGKNMKYKPEINVFRDWSWKHQQPGVPFQLPFTPNVMPDLASAMNFNPDLKILLLGGYFDLGTAFYAAEYQMHQLTIPAKLQKNISYDFFPSGHMIYLNPKVLKPLHDRVAEFIESNYKAQ